MKRYERKDTVPGTEKYEEYKLLPQFWGWVILLAWSVSLIVWALWLHAIIPDTERQWSYGALPQVPAESIYSTVPAPREAEPRQQMEPLPGARPLEPARSEERQEE